MCWEEPIVFAKELRFRHIWAEFTRGAQHWYSLLTNVNTPFFHSRCRIRARCCGAGGPSRRLGLCIRCSLLCLRGVTVYSHISDTQGVNTTTLVQTVNVYSPLKGLWTKAIHVPFTKLQPWYIHVKGQSQSSGFLSCKPEQFALLFQD